MKFYSLNKQAPNVSFKDAVIAGIAPDRGLYFPERIEPLPVSFFENIEELSNLYICLLEFSHLDRVDSISHYLAQI